MPKVLGIGTDIHKLSRFFDILKRNGPLDSYKTQRFSERILNPVYELPTFIEYKSKHDIERCARILSISWCVKEAIFKTLDGEDQSNFVMSDWYKTNDLRGRPQVGNDKYLKIKQEEFLCSLSHDGNLVSSFIIRQSKPSVTNCWNGKQCND
ncbi:hypothetical protein CAS74_000473 [Pichia kudriavzevii]|uniref:Holo-[acyl-carrier-protein] synthase n=1 Tax=Pichia kudriavzevii TaxID=4909 RepID=A0A1V2LN62_PICKU|nr:uncharacterized protein C5L36_0C04610 [Pichia kudriavzevii]AWU76528.1 hypothetical protein C5L36_0C04610 [Pichia kudriavzevii]ONH73927.1 Holo-[acyl-carrier-protein] synthase [Pichia kudriavzevii]OUT24090.1 hypothetical protein CAS74_000473 [Pichia kudriavzevii]